VDPLHATIEEFAAEGYTHVECFCPRCRVIYASDEPASENLDGTHARCAGSSASMRWVRWGAAIRQAVAVGGCAWEAGGAKRLALVAQDGRHCIATSALSISVRDDL